MKLHDVSVGPFGVWSFSSPQEREGTVLPKSMSRLPRPPPTRISLYQSKTYKQRNETSPQNLRGTPQERDREKGVKEIKRDRQTPETRVETDTDTNKDTGKGLGGRCENTVGGASEKESGTKTETVRADVQSRVLRRRRVRLQTLFPSTFGRDQTYPQRTTLITSVFGNVPSFGRRGGVL